MPSSRQLAGLAPLFLWASEGDVRHFGSASNAPQSLIAALPSSRQPASLPLLFLWASLWPVRSLSPLFLWASEGNVRHFGSASNAPQSLTAALPSSRQLAGLAPLFLWASEGNVRHFGPPSNAPRQLAGLLRPLCGLSEACRWQAWLLFSYGLPKATLGILARLQTLPRASPQPCPLLGSLQACLFSSYGPLCGLSEACLLFSYGLPKATLGILARLQTLPRASPQPCPLLGSWQAWLLFSYGLPKATLGILDRLQTLLGSWQACCGLSVACPKPASSLLMGFRRRR